MAKSHFTTCFFSIDNAAGEVQTWTSYVKSITINFSREELDRGYAGCVGRARGAGLYDWEMTVELWQDFADNTVDEYLYGIVSGGSTVSVAFRPSSASQSATNPTYAGEGIVTEYPLALAHGQNSMVTFTVRGADGAALTRTAT